MKVRFIFTILLASLFGTKSVLAQKGFSIGGDYGYYGTFIMDKNRFGDVNYEAKLRTGSIYGLAVGNNFTDRIGLHTGIYKANLGGNFTFNRDNQAYDKNLDLTYMQIPVLLKIMGGDWKSRFTASIGPQFGYLTSARMTATGGKNPGSDMDVINRFSRNDISMLLTAGGDISLTRNVYLNVGIRMQYGMMQANTDSHILDMDATGAEKLGNAALGANVGLHYLFRSNKEEKK